MVGGQGSSASSSSFSSSSSARVIRYTPRGVGGSSSSSATATVDLLKLQNISQTLALANVPSGSDVVSVELIVSSVAIEINGSKYPVSIATGGNILLVPLSIPLVSGGANALLIELSPVIANSSSGYQLIPSSVGVLRPHSELTDQDGTVGSSQRLSDQDEQELHHAKGKITATLTSLSVSGETTTTMSILVTNVGSIPERLILFGIHGEFEGVCESIITTPTTTATTSPSGAHDSSSSDRDHEECHGDPDEVIFIPGAPQTTTVTVTTTISGCAPRHMSLANIPDSEKDLINPIVMNPGQCLNFTFSGIISRGQSGNHVIVPSTEPGQEFSLHIVAANDAKETLSCTLPLSTQASCIVDSDDGGG